MSHKDLRGKDESLWGGGVRRERLPGTLWDRYRKGRVAADRLYPVPFVCWLCLGEAKPGATLPLLLSGREEQVISYALALTLVALLADKACPLEICQLQCH